jgi:hypothetical protein
MLEEASAKALIEGIVVRLGLPDSLVARFIVFEGKQDLEKQLEHKVRSYLNPDARFIIMRDQDSGDCKIVKERLVAKCRAATDADVLVRIACRELESWYLADLSAVSRAYVLPHIATRQEESKYRNPDTLESPSRELKNMVPAYQKVSGSRAIAQFLDLDNARSRSFHHFVESIKIYGEA